MKIKLLKNRSWPPPNGRNTIYLHQDKWNDDNFLTSFDMHVHDENGKLHNIGSVKIATKGQERHIHTYDLLEKTFDILPVTFYSLGQTADYYLNLMTLSQAIRTKILTNLNDLVEQPYLLKSVNQDDVLKYSILRDVSLTSIEGQFKRILQGLAILTDFDFAYSFNTNAFDVERCFKFNVKANSEPRTNIHAVIGRNGVGKTTFLNNIVASINKLSNINHLYCKTPYDIGYQKLGANYFSSLISVSYSAFDPFDPPINRRDPSKGTTYYYLGLKDTKNQVLKTLEELHIELQSSIKSCISKKKELWKETISQLNSDINFAEKDFCSLIDAYKLTDFDDKLNESIKGLSSGHLIVLLTLSQIIELIEEKTLILMDEPETHLHPPLLSAFIRALSDLMAKKNAVAILATHSPVVLQEIPKSCVSIFHRINEAVEIYRPEKETFGENVGILTKSVFGLEVTESGFHALLEQCVNTGSSYEDIIAKYNNQLGLEARKILQIMLLARELKNDQAK